MAEKKPKPLTKEQRKELHYCLANEGFEYSFVGYSEFKHIKNAEFHRLREEYVKAHKALQSFVGSPE